MPPLINPLSVPFYKTESTKENSFVLLVKIKSDWLGGLMHIKELCISLVQFISTVLFTVHIVPEQLYKENAWGKMLKKSWEKQIHLGEFCASSYLFYFLFFSTKHTHTHTQILNFTFNLRNCTVVMTGFNNLIEF